MRLATLFAISLLLTACGEALSEEEQRAANAAAADEVRAANDAAPPVEEIVPEPIEAAEIEANDLLGAACSFAPGTSGAVRLIAREADAVIKLGGDLVRFAADPGSRQLPANTRTLYNGTQYALRIDIDEEAAGEGLYQGTLWLYDRWDRVVYTGTGAVRCST